MLPLSVHILNNPNMSLITDKHEQSPFLKRPTTILFPIQIPIQQNRHTQWGWYLLSMFCQNSPPSLPHPPPHPHTCLMPPQLRAHQFILQSNQQHTRTLQTKTIVYIFQISNKEMSSKYEFPVILQVDRTTIHHNPIQHLSSNYSINYIYTILYTL